LEDSWRGGNWEDSWRGLEESGGKRVSGEVHPTS